MQLLTQILGALAAGALVFVVARRCGAEPHRAYGAVALVAVAVAAVLAVPKLRDDVSALLDQRRQYAGMSSAEAQLQGGVSLGIDVGFLAWVGERIGEDETFHLQVGRLPGEGDFEGTGVNQAATLAWASYQLAPRLLVEQSGSGRDLVPGEGRNADWIVLYGVKPSEYPDYLERVITYAPDFAIARTERAR